MNDKSALTAPPPVLLDKFAALVGAQYALRDDAAMHPFLVEWRDKFVGKAALILRPGSVEEIAAILKLANETRTAIVPQGGNTGLVGGQIPFERGDEIVLSLGRLNKIERVDTRGNILTAQAGCTLASIQQAADAVDRLFPLSLGSEGTCQIGGNLSTNAGGTAVLAYGNARDLVLGLQVVLADGRIWDGRRALRKDNTGYDLKQLFVGSEGTLGIITGAVLKLFPKPRSVETAFVALPNPAAAVELFHRAQDLFGRAVTSFEIMPQIGMEFAARHIPGARAPFAAPSPWYVLLEISSGETTEHMRPRLEALLGAAIEDELVIDAVLANALAQAQDFWRLRTGLSEVQKHEGGSIKHDISVPVSAIPTFLEEGAALIERLIPGARPVPFGHLGDGNLHYNISQPVGADKQAFLDRWEEVNEAVHALVTQHKGSISAEHGIGRLKRDLLPGVKSAVEMDLMRSLKRTLDPNNILNPGKVL